MADEQAAGAPASVGALGTERPRRDGDGRAQLRVLESLSKDEFLDRLKTDGFGGQGLAGVVKGLLESKDDRVRARAVEFVARCAGWMGDAARQVTAPEIHIHIGVPALVRPAAAKPPPIDVAAVPAANGKPTT